VRLARSPTAREPGGRFLREIPRAGGDMARKKQTRSSGLNRQAHQQALELARQTISGVETTYKPYTDYSECGDEELIYHIVLNLISGIQCVLASVRPDSPPNKELCREASRLASHPTPDNLAFIILRMRPLRPEPLHFLVERKINYDKIFDEIYKRIQPIPKEVMNGLTSPEATTSMESMAGKFFRKSPLVGKMARIKIRGGWLQKEAPEDLMQTMLEAVFKYDGVQIGETRIPPGAMAPPLPPYLGFSSTALSEWDKILANLFKQMVDFYIRRLIPDILTGLEKASKRGTQTLGNLEDSVGTQKRDEEGYEEWFKEVSRQPPPNLAVARAYRQAKALRGEEGQRFLKAIFEEDATVEEASREIFRAERDTGQKFLAKLRLTLGVSKKRKPHRS